MAIVGTILGTKLHASGICVNTFEMADLNRVGTFLVDESQVNIFQALHLESGLVEHTVGLVYVLRQCREVGGEHLVINNYIFSI